MAPALQWQISSASLQGVRRAAAVGRASGGGSHSASPHFPGLGGSLHVSSEGFGWALCPSVEQLGLVPAVNQVLIQNESQQSMP